jgi:hypothetical protein
MVSAGLKTFNVFAIFKQVSVGVLRIIGDKLNTLHVRKGKMQKQAGTQTGK